MNAIMKKSYPALLFLALPAMAMAQSAIDAQQVSQSDLKGTARFMSMGGAFTALGGDMSAISQNPGSIGVYRKSEIGATMDINMQKTETTALSNAFPTSMSQTKVYCNNFGYVGSVILGNSGLTTFNWGVTYNRAQSFDRQYQGYVPSTNTSLSNYVASYTGGTAASDMDFTTTYDPYLDSNIDWLSILSYNSYMINPTNAAGTEYAGLYKGNTAGDALFNVREQGYVDQYDISFGGNVDNVVSWGLSIGITDLNYKRWAFYSESMANAYVPTESGNMTNGAAGFDLDNFKYIKGSGWNLKGGVIIRPINELRIGLAVHTPTWYNLSTTYNAGVQYAYTPTDENDNVTGSTLTNAQSNYPWEETDDAYYQWRFNSPWKLMVGVAAVLGQRAIVSADYQFDGYHSMNVKSPYYYDNYGYDFDYQPNTVVNNDISTYFQNANTVRLGLEYRVTPQFSVRAGYNVKFTNVKKDTSDGATEVFTSGTDPSYEFDKTIQHISAGLGYRYKAWYIDAAYVYQKRDSRYHAYTNFNGYTAPQVDIKGTNSSIVLSTGFKF